MITLYYREDCPFCWKVRLAMHELDIAYESVITRLGEKHPDVLVLNPKGSVPVLVDGGLVLWESSVIVEYLNDLSPDSSLLPANARYASELRMLAHYSDAVIGPALRDTVFEKRSKSEDAWDRELLDASEKAWRRCLTDLETRLNGRSGFSKAFSVADCALVARFGLADHYGVGVDQRHPNLLSWYERMRQRQSFIATEPERPWPKKQAVA